MYTESNNIMKNGVIPQVSEGVYQFLTVPSQLLFVFKAK